MMADKQSGVPAQVLAAIREGKPIPDARLAALSALTTAMVTTQGRPPADVLKASFAPGFEDRHVLDIVLALAVKTLSNYSNHAFATPVDAVFAPYAVSKAG